MEILEITNQIRYIVYYYWNYYRMFCFFIFLFNWTIKKNSGINFKNPRANFKKSGTNYQGDRRNKGHPL